MKKLEQHDLEQVAGAYTAEEIRGDGTVVIIVQDGGNLWIF